MNIICTNTPPPSHSAHIIDRLYDDLHHIRSLMLNVHDGSHNMHTLCTFYHQKNYFHTNLIYNKHTAINHYVSRFFRKGDEEITQTAKYLQC
jgi:hypothetical protein